MIEIAYELITYNNLKVDITLKKLNIRQEDYRKVYPDTPISKALALDICEIKEEERLTNKQVKKRWSLSNSQLHYVLYNDDAIKTKSNDYELPRVRVLKELKKKNKSQTDIAKDNHVSQSFVHKIAKENDLLPCNRKARTVLTKDQLNSIKKAVDNGEAVDYLAKQYDVSRDTIYKQLRSSY